MKTVKKHHGIVVPMVTPFTAEGELDEGAARRIIDFLLQGGVDGIFILGTTGEKASIPVSMRRKLIRLAVEHVNCRALVYAGISDDCLSHSLEAAEESFRLGVDAVAAHPPCYYSLQPDELLDYFITLANNLSGPLLLYNIPSTTHVSIPVEVIARLSQQPNVVGLKDSENREGRPEEVVRYVGGREGFSLFIGTAALAAQAFSLGMDGVVPSSANLVPHLWRQVYTSAKASDWEAVEQSQSRVNRVASVFQRNRTLGQSLAALKAAMSTLGLCSPHMLPPLRSLTEAQIEIVQQDLNSLETGENGVPIRALDKQAFSRKMR